MGQQFEPGPARDAGKDAQYGGRGSGATGKGESGGCLAVEVLAAVQASFSRTGSGRKCAPTSSNLYSERQVCARIPGASLRKRDGKSSPTGFRVPGPLLGQRLYSNSSPRSAARPSIWAAGRRICWERISRADPRWTLPGGRHPGLRHSSRRSGKGAVSGSYCNERREFPDRRGRLWRLSFPTITDATHELRAAALGSIDNSRKGGDRSERWHFYSF
jgi:hypothetical protein